MSTEHSWRDDFSRARVVGFLIALALTLAILPMAAAPDGAAETATAQVAARSAGKALRDAVVEKSDGIQRVRIDYSGPDNLAKPIREAFRHERIELVGAERDADFIVTAVASVTDGHVGVTYDPEPAIEPKEGEEAPKFEATSRVGGFEALMPPVLAILIALFFRRVLLALGCAVWLGATISVGGNPLMGLWVALSKFVFGSVSATFNAYIIGFTLTLVGMIQIVTMMGGIAGLLDRFRRFTSTARSARVTTALLGTAIFFDDYANTIVVGTSMRPITDQRGISREKLAYLVDSMSAPVAGIAIISTWVGYEVGLFGELSAQLGLGRSGYDIFFSIIGFRFYCLLTIVFVLANAFLGRDFGPMLRAERRAVAGDVARPGSKMLTTGTFSVTAPAPGIPHRWYNAVLPIGLVIIAAIGGMYWSGWSGGELSIPPLGGDGLVEAWTVAARDMGNWGAWRDAFSNADSAKVLFWASITGTVAAFVLAVGQRLLTPVEAALSFGRTVPAMWLAIAILVLAWSIRAVCDDLGTSIYLVGVVGDLLAPAALPVVTFLLAAAVAFATGTSWGTMGILLPAMVPLAFYLTEGMADAELILLLCFGAVLDGAIFGDHCSPISDTTVMSSIASSCDHLDHVRTQIPYALTTMFAAGFFGYMGVAFGLPVSVALLMGVVAVVSPLYLLGRPIVPEGSSQNGDSNSDEP